MSQLSTGFTKKWLEVARSVVKKRGRSFHHLRFAKRTNTGYAFFEAIHNEAFDMLHEITQEVSVLFPHLSFAQVAETSSEMANTEEFMPQKVE